MKEAQKKKEESETVKKADDTEPNTINERVEATNESVAMLVEATPAVSDMIESPVSFESHPLNATVEGSQSTPSKQSLSSLSLEPNVEEFAIAWKSQITTEVTSSSLPFTSSPKTKTAPPQFNADAHEVEE